MSHARSLAARQNATICLANAPATSTPSLPNAGPDNHTFSSGGRGFFFLAIASSLVGPIARFPGHHPLDRPTVGGATPTLLGGVPIRGACSSAHLLISNHVHNGDRVELETGRVRRPLLADWLKRDSMPMLDSIHAHACWRTREECCEQSVVVVRAKMGVVIVDVKILSIK